MLFFKNILSHSAVFIKPFKTVQMSVSYKCTSDFSFVHLIVLHVSAVYVSMFIGVDFMLIDICMHL